MKVTKIEIVPIHPQSGLIAFASIELDNMFYVSSIGIHKKRNETGFRITYPTKKIGEHSLTICHPIQSNFSKEIEREICVKAEELFGISD